MYKLSAEEANGKFEPRIKISENPAKITNPGVKRLYRFYDRLSGKALADLIALEDEDYSSGEPLEIFDPENTWKKMTLCDYEVRPLLAPIFENGELVYTLPTLSEISEYAKREMETFWDEYKRLHSPHRYKVDLSKPLYELKRGMLEERRSKACLLYTSAAGKPYALFQRFINRRFQIKCVKKERFLLVGIFDMRL